MIVVRGVITVTSTRHDEMVKVAAEVEPPSRSEPGCVDYDFWIDPSTRGRFHVSELWEDEEALAAHVATPHYREFARSLRSLSPESIDVQTFVAEPIPEAR